MKKLVLFTAMAAVAMFGASCIQIRTNDSASPAIKTAVETVYYKADVETGDTQVTGTASQNVLFSFIKWGDGNLAERTDLGCCAEKSALPLPLPLPIFNDASAAVKQAAVYNACKKAQCDALAAAKYTLNVEDYIVFKRITCTVKGFPVTQKSIKRVDAPAGCCCK